MNDDVYVEFLVEDNSGKILLEKIMNKYTESYSNITYRINGFKGIGGLPTKNVKISEVKTRRLLSDLPGYLKGFNRSLSFLPKKAIFVVVDCDDKVFSEFNNQLLDMYDELNLDIDVFFCIAVEEMEAWLLGDSDAVMSAYPNAKRPLLQNYEPDTIIGTWELLADIVFQGGVAQLKKNASSYYEIGAEKCKWAKDIGELMDIRNNKSPSFNYLLSKWFNLRISA
ncbi:DUF4276 family protein [Paenibacillus sp. HW567]|uniref:DUF4276 family protein n=1 Tax=Paenibacillus sp. HW567 TaxID=1034769 RepID=UPI00037C663B|nr:DUF4276 family protein [Paenibacillus sp. HW567]